jgi:hypothetical protein
MASRRLSSTRRRVVAEIVRLTLPAYPELDEQARARVHADVTGFVVSQIEGLPSFLHLPYRLGITTFHLLSLLRYGRRFASLPDAARESYLSFWSDGVMGPTRDFIKLIRSCALLAYFDHPGVRRRLLAEREGKSAVIAPGAQSHS